MIPENEISKIIVDAAIEVHRELGGPGLVEEVYEEALEEELRLRAVRVDRQLPVRIVYKGRVLRKPLRLDMKVQGLVLVENKAVVDWNAIHEAQMLTYLRLTGLRLGLVINFGERVLKAGIHRVVNGLPEEVDFFNAKTQRRNLVGGRRATTAGETVESRREAPASANSAMSEWERRGSFRSKTAGAHRHFRAFSSLLV